MRPSLLHPKRRGEWVELQFMARAHSHGLIVSKPWGDSARYDFIVECPQNPDARASKPLSQSAKKRSSRAARRSAATKRSRVTSALTLASKQNPRTTNQEPKTRFYRVQVKSTLQTAKHKNGPPGAYLCNTISRGPCGRAQTYSLDEVDFFALFVIPLDLWYIIPLADLPRSCYALLLDTTRPGNKYFKYLEAWHLLQR